MVYLLTALFSWRMTAAPRRACGGRLHFHLTLLSMASRKYILNNLIMNLHYVLYVPIM